MFHLYPTSFVWRLISLLLFICFPMSAWLQMVNNDISVVNTNSSALDTFLQNLYYARDDLHLLRNIVRNTSVVISKQLAESISDTESNKKFVKTGEMNDIPVREYHLYQNISNVDHKCLENSTEGEDVHHQGKLKVYNYDTLGLLFRIRMYNSNEMQRQSLQQLQGINLYSYTNVSYESDFVSKYVGHMYLPYNFSNLYHIAYNSSSTNGISSHQEPPTSGTMKCYLCNVCNNSSFYDKSTFINISFINNTHKAENVKFQDEDLFHQLTLANFTFFCDLLKKSNSSNSLHTVLILDAERVDSAHVSFLKTSDTNSSKDFPDGLRFYGKKSGIDMPIIISVDALVLTCQ